MELDLRLNLRDILERVKDLFDIEKDSDIARIIGISENTLHIEISKNNLYSRTFKKIFAFAIDSGLSINWILYGIRENNLSNKSIINYEKELTDNIKKLTPKRQEYYYHKIKADLIEEELDK